MRAVACALLLAVVACGERPAGASRVRAVAAATDTSDAIAQRSVAALRFSGPVQLVVGDAAQALPVVAYAPNGAPLAAIVGQVSVGDSGLVALEDMRVRPLRPGASTITVSVGDARATTGLHVYEPARTLDVLRHEPRLIAVRLRLASGEMRRWSLPWGVWMLSMWPEHDSSGVRLRVEGANCRPTEQISGRRHLCSVTQEATVIVYAPWSADGARELTGTLAVKPSGETRSSDAAPTSLRASAR